MNASRQFYGHCDRFIIPDGTYLQFTHLDHPRYGSSTRSRQRRLNIEIPSDDLLSAIMKSGAKDVRISEDAKLALDRVMDGEVPAGVISVVTPEKAAQWTGVPGYTVLRLPLQRTKGSPG